MKTKIIILVVLGCVVFGLSTVLVGYFLGKDLVSSSVATIDSIASQASITTSTAKTYTSMTLHSSAFANNQPLPADYTCDGSGVNPPLEFSAVPKNAKSLALIVEDQDVPKSIRTDGLWYHWLVWDMPAGTTGIDSGEEAPGIVGKNTSGTFAYTPPCPPDREHRYIFTLYALDTMLNLEASTTKDDLQKAMKGHILEQSELIGLYNRQ